ncbi:MAG: Crp/Fnr family transcriptional regulator, partial [Planctomycetes bacterium]|nr:Crp/Fnr family transcriptional regulator [Planctomycetota bacterium]
LKHVTLFSGLDAKAREAIARLAVERKAAAGQMIIRDGRPADGFYVVLEGKVKVYKLSPDGRQQILHVFGPGQAFAEAAMFAGETFPAFAETLAESRLAFFPRDRFLKGLGDSPALAFGLIASLARLCRQLTTLVEQISLTDVAGRLARYLADLARRKGVSLEKGASVRLDMPKGELARQLGASPETLSRALARLAAADIIAVDGRIITFRRPDELEALAGGRGAGR